MAKPRKLADFLAQLQPIRHDPTTEEAQRVLRQILERAPSIAVAEASKLIGEAELYSLIPPLVQAFDRFLVKPVDTDPGCRAKKSLIETLYRLNHTDERPYLSGIHHVQMEPVWGGQEDTAAKLRAISALGLVRMNYPHVMVELADLLADPDPEARLGAVRAIAYSEDPASVPLLRLRVQIGDTPPVLSECLLALLHLDGDRSLPLVHHFLYAKLSPVEENIPIAEAAALALGESRVPEAFHSLQTWWQQVKSPVLRQSGLLAIAMLRQDQCIPFLMAILREGGVTDARGAVAALGLYRHNTALWQEVTHLVEQRQLPVLQPEKPHEKPL